MTDQPLIYHQSFSPLLSSFQNIIVGITWLKATIKSSKAYHKKWPYIITLPCSVTDEEVKIDKSILTKIEKEGYNKATPLYTRTLISAYRMFTISVNDIVWEESDFSAFHDCEQLQFLRHIRNASAHNNKFYWGKGQQRKNTLSKLPVSWNGKIINKELENELLYMDFLKPGDLFILLSDISKLVNKNMVKR